MASYAYWFSRNVSSEANLRMKACETGRTMLNYVEHNMLHPSRVSVSHLRPPPPLRPCETGWN